MQVAGVYAPNLTVKVVKRQEQSSNDVFKEQFSYNNNNNSLFSVAVIHDHCHICQGRMRFCWTDSE